MFAVWPFLIKILLFITSVFAAGFSGSDIAVLDGGAIQVPYNCHPERLCLPHNPHVTSMGVGVSVLIFSAPTRAFPRSHATRSCQHAGRPDAPHFNRRFYAMMPLEEASLKRCAAAVPAV